MLSVPFPVLRSDIGEQAYIYRSQPPRSRLPTCTYLLINALILLSSHIPFTQNTAFMCTHCLHVVLSRIS